LEAYSGKEAINQMTSNLVDLVILDYKLSDMTGDIVAKQVKEMNPETPIVFITGYSEAKEKINNTNLSQHIMVKPIKENEFLLVFSGFLFYTNNLILKGYLEFEHEDIIEQTEIGLNTLELRISEVSHTTSDYAGRDDTYYFIQNNMRHFINDLISTSSFIENELNFMIFIDNEANVLYSKAFDLTTLQSLELEESTIDRVLGYEKIVSEHQVSGIIELNKVPTMIATHEITYSDDELPPVGTLICGRYIDAIEVAKLCDYSYQDLRFIEYTDSPIDSSDDISIWKKDENTIIGIKSIYDINGEPYLAMLAESPRDLYNQGMRTIVYFYGAMIIIGAIGGLIKDP